MRYLAPFIRTDLKEKMVLLAGPRQCGKATLAKALMDDRGTYLNWDIAGDRKIIRELAWPKNASLVVLDELHKAPKWKNLLTTSTACIPSMSPSPRASCLRSALTNACVVCSEPVASLRRS